MSHQDDTEVKEEMVQVCKILWKLILQKQREIKESRGILPVVDDISLLKVKHRRLEGEIQELEDKDPQILPISTPVLKEIAKTELIASVSELEQTRKIVRKEKEKMAEDLKREQELILPLQTINEDLKEKVKGTQKDVSSFNWYLKDLEKKEQMFDKQVNELMKFMSNFLYSHFPLPDPENVKQNENQRQTRRQSQMSTSLDSDMFSLKFIIETLMNKCLETPHDAYLTITDQMWTPYISLLIHCNIGMFHPEDHRRIKLVPFHL